MTAAPETRAPGGGGRDRAMPLGEHFEELRSRLVRCLVVFAAVFVAGWVFRQPVLSLLLRPHMDAAVAAGFEPTIKYQSYVEPLYAQMLAVSLVALLAISPYALFELWGFVSPALFQKELQVARKVAVWSVVLFAAGASFGFFVLLPLCLRFMLYMAGPGTEPVIMIRSYFRLVFMTTVFLGLTFQTPLVMYALIRFHVLTPEWVQRNRRVAIVAAFVIAAILTPPDAFTQIIVAIPMILLYDIGVIAAAPSRRSILSALKLLGICAVLVGGAWAWRTYRPAASVETPNGPATVREGGLIVAGDARRTVRTGSRGRARVLLAPGGRLRASAPGELALLSGACLVTVPPAARNVRVTLADAEVLVESGEAEIVAPEDAAPQVTCVAGTVTVRTGGRVVRLKPGRALTLDEDGRPASVGAVRARWGQEGEKP